MRVLVASAALAAASYAIWDALDHALGRGLAGQIVSLGVALVAGAVVYFVAVTLLRIPEINQIRGLLRRDRATSAAAVQEDEPEYFEDYEEPESGEYEEPESGEYEEPESGEYEYEDDEPESGEYAYLDDEEYEDEEPESDEDEDEVEAAAEDEDAAVAAAEELIRGLVILPGGPRAGEHFLLEHETFAIGRSPEGDLVLEDRSVSRRHARLVREDDGGYRVEDLGSHNGTFVNRRRIESRRLDDGDEIQLGVYALGYLERA